MVFWSGNDTSAASTMALGMYEGDVHNEKPGMLREVKTQKDCLLTTCPKERICSPLACIKSVSVRPSTGESSSDPKSAT